MSYELSDQREKSNQAAIERLIDLMERNKILFSVMPFTTDILIDKHRAMEDARLRLSR